MMKVTATVTGTRNFITALRLMNVETQARVKAAVRESTLELRNEARALVHLSKPPQRKSRKRPGPGELRDTIREYFPPSSDGFIGYVQAGYGKLNRRLNGRGKTASTRKRGAKARARRAAAGVQRDLGIYAMVVEYGSPSEGKAAQPYIRPAAARVRPLHQERLRRALSAAADAAARGAGSAAA